MIAKIAYLTSPAPNRFLFKYQEEGKDGICEVEISRAHLINILIDGASHAFREQYITRVPTLQPESADNERADHRRQQPA
jgi:hypothetical protein